GGVRHFVRSGPGRNDGRRGVGCVRLEGVPGRAQGRTRSARSHVPLLHRGVGAHHSGSDPLTARPASGAQGMTLGQSGILRAFALSGALPMAQLAAGVARPAYAAAAEARPMVIFDQDAAGPAGSYMQSMLMLLQDKDIDLLGICIVSGDAWRDEEVSHTLRLLEIDHRTAIPVLPGAVFPLLNGRRRTRAWEGLYGKLFYDGAYMRHWPSEDTVSWTPLHPTRPYWVPPLPEGNPAIHASTESAAAFMLRMVHEHPHQV